MLRNGYVATINPKWANGITLGVEDMAHAVDFDPDTSEEAFAIEFEVGAG